MNMKLTPRMKGGWACTLALGLLAAWVAVAEAQRGRHAPAHGLSKMRLAYTWGPIDFVFDSPEQRRAMEANGTFKQGNAVPFDVDVHSASGRVFIALPYMLAGAAVTLATVEDRNQQFAPRLRPYPDWSWHAGARGCEGLTSVFRMHIDRCNRLWVIDSGLAEFMGAVRRQCPPQLFVFDLATDRLLVRHSFLEPEANCDGSFMLNVAVEQMGDRCSQDAFAYVADARAKALYVYSLKDDRSWRVASALFYPDVNARQFLVAGTSLALMDGLLGLAVAPRPSSCGRQLFFHSLASFQEGRVCTAVLRNASLFNPGPHVAPAARFDAEQAFSFVGRREQQSSAEQFSSTGVLFFHQFGKNSINCWNQQMEYASPNLPVVDQDTSLLRFVTGLKVVPAAPGAPGGQEGWQWSSRGKGLGAGAGEKEEEEVWAIANNAQQLFSGAFRPNANNTVNVVRGGVRALTRGTRCG